MTQLTGFFQGTPQSDTYLGEVLTTDAILIDNDPNDRFKDLVGIGADALAIDSLGGDDTIEAITSISTFGLDQSPFGGTISAFGTAMVNANINTGAGADTFTAKSFASSRRSTLSIGLQDSGVETKGGDDTIVISGRAEARDISALLARGVGLLDSILNAGAGNDTVTVTASSEISSQGNPTGRAKGLDGSSLAGNQGEDIIQISASARSSAFITGGTASASGITRGSNVSGGANNDTISITSSARVGNGRGGGSAEALGVGVDSVVRGDGGADTITIAASTDAVGTLGAITTATGVALGLVEGNGGDDTIDITAEIKSGGGNAIGVSSSTVSGGTGNDKISISVQGFTDAVPNQDFFGASDAFISGGRANDEITIESTYTPTPFILDRERLILNNSIGLVSSTLNAGAGDDLVTVSGLNLDLQDAIINGGGGADIFDTGVGTANISGGGGQDTLKLDFFDAATMSITALGNNGLYIVGTQDKQGNSVDWTQTVSGVEQYEVAGTLYSAADVVSLLG
ncbi:MAG: beta strand repeat-containing protein [Leptolyngbyaceae cyanobacterium]